jgi:hypothetical protein
MNEDREYDWLDELYDDWLKQVENGITIPLGWIATPDPHIYKPLPPWLRG